MPCTMPETLTLDRSIYEALAIPEMWQANQKVCTEQLETGASAPVSVTVIHTDQAVSSQ